MRLLNCKECSLHDFLEAMAHQDDTISLISTPRLYILYTHFYEDARRFCDAETLYHRNLGYKFQKQADLYKAELINRLTEEECYALGIIHKRK